MTSRSLSPSPSKAPLVTPSLQASRDLAHQLEEIEAAAWENLYRDLPGPVVRKCGIRTRSFDTAVAVGASGASMGPAETLPEARRRAVQQALLERHLRDAAAQGCGCLSVETAEPRPDHRVALPAQPLASRIPDRLPADQLAPGSHGSFSRRRRRR